MRSKKQVNNNTYERQNIEVISPRGKTERKKAEKKHITNWNGIDDVH